MGDPRPVGEIVAEVVDELLRIKDGKSDLVVYLDDVRHWVRSDPERWRVALRRGKSFRRAQAMTRRMERARAV